MLIELNSFKFVGGGKDIENWVNMVWLPGSGLPELLLDHGGGVGPVLTIDVQGWLLMLLQAQIAHFFLEVGVDRGILRSGERARSAKTFGGRLVLTRVLPVTVVNALSELSQKLRLVTRQLVVDIEILLSQAVIITLRLSNSDSALFLSINWSVHETEEPGAFGPTRLMLVTTIRVGIRLGRVRPTAVVQTSLEPLLVQVFFHMKIYFNCR